MSQNRKGSSHVISQKDLSDIDKLNPVVSQFKVTQQNFDIPDIQSEDGNSKDY